MSKHPLVPGIDQKTVRDLFVRHQKTHYRLLLATAIEYLKCPAEEADAFLRRLANAGYLEWAWNETPAENNDWTLTEHGRRLAADDLGPRLSRQAVDSIIETVTTRARTINADPDRIARVTELRLFGSALDNDRNDFGDVDIEARIEIRKLPTAEVARAHEKLASKVPRSWRASFFRNLDAEEEFDRRNVFTVLRRGIKGLSLSKNAIQIVGCEYRCVYRFDPDAGEELSPGNAIVPRTTPTPKTAEEISVPLLPASTVIRPLNLAMPDEGVCSDQIRIPMSDIAYTEAVAWLGKPTRHGPCVPVDTTKTPSQRLAGAQFLFDEWRDPILTGLELFQRTLDWASLYDLPISKAGRNFTLRTYQNTRIANFHALLVRRVADRIEAELLVRKSDRGSAWYQAGGSRTTTPRMIAAHHALAVAFGRMLDETRLTGQIDFRAEFDLSAQRRNAYPPLPDLSDMSRRLRRMLPKVKFPEAALVEARKRKEDYEPHLPLSREIEILTYLDKDTEQPAGRTSANLGADWWEQEPIAIDEDGFEPYAFLPGEEELWDVCELLQKRPQQALGELPGCRLLSITHKAPVADIEHKTSD